tara:strand:- start:57 stop:1121 length:1065 start_codon:yes stop_codon:yes gene_type:complete
VNVLYLGHYRENSSIGYSSKRYIHAINNIDYINLSVRPLYLQKNVSSNIPPHILTCEQNSSDYYDMVIQDTFPEYYEYNGSFGKNICMPKIISRNLQHTGWIDKINMMDEVWVNSYFAEKSLRESGVDKLIKVIPEPFDLNIETSEKSESDKEFNFYSISSLEDKDNLLSLMIAYITEFDKTEGVRLIIKTQECKEEEIKKLLNRAYGISKKSSADVNEPVIIVGFVEEEKMQELMNNTDCYIDVSSGSYSTASCVEALINKKITACVEGTSCSSYISNTNGFIIKGDTRSILSDNKYSTHKISSIYEQYQIPHIDSIRSIMRNAYELTDQEKQSKIDNINTKIFDHKEFSRYM